ncbi:thymic stromal cotransporter homolog [Rhinatrema bivittatum]|uniref:thymic stromal cotransporter homolog n=1 Tax=Rhinatrema bivittatum TaxID=194408 RepID=UPI0011285F0A|nr:thymic stromal cotransporter homolog [Rhinatrema bivittatum]
MSWVMLVRTWVEPVVAGAQLASSLYDTGLLLVVKDYYNRTNPSSGNGTEDGQLKAVSNFYIIYNLVLGLCPLLPAYILARLGDEKNRKITVCVPLCGYLLSRIMLLLLVLLDWPVEVLYGSAALNGLTGGFTAYWAGIMAVAAVGSRESRRSLRFIIIELTYGLAGFAGSLASGHVFKLSLTYRQGTALISCSIALYLFCVLYSLFVLKVPGVGGRASQATEEPDEAAGGTGEESTYKPPPAGEGSRLLSGRREGNSSPGAGQSQAGPTPSRVVLALLFASAVAYELAVAGAVADVLQLFVLEEPLSWDAVTIGYGNAAGYGIFITSFLGVCAFSRCLRDTTMVMIGMLSFSAGVFVMAFARRTYLYFIARVVMLFTLIPLPTIRSMLSKQVQGSSYGKVFVVLQLSLGITGVFTSTIYNKIFQATVHWFSGFCFILSCIISSVSIIPIGIVHYKESVKRSYSPISSQ